MHGRVKVRTTEEEKLRKDKERQAKLHRFRSAMSKIQYKRRDGYLDLELLEYTRQMLTMNPDIYTLWNIRREVLVVLSKDIEDGCELSKLYDSELYLTEGCLKINPKSYCAWHQREWVLTTRSDPDWRKELALCNIYLNYDERNFHVWDFRRFVVSHDKTTLDKEFKYTTEKIHQNFSNYSAWHYRSKMLVQLYPDNEEGRPIADKQHSNELAIVQSAAFTDPDDTSAWFYLRWLLGAVKKVKEVVACLIKPQLATVAFNVSISEREVSTAVTLYFNDNLVQGEWISACRNDHDFVWTLELSEDITEDMNIKVEYYEQEINCKYYQNATYMGTLHFNFRSSYSAPVIKELKKQMESCYQLLQLEPDSKWTLLTATVLMHCCDPAENLRLALKNLTKLKHIDTLRSGYYDDLASKWILEEYLESYGGQIDNVPSLHSLYSFKITSIYYIQYFSCCTDVDFSNQNLTSRVLPCFIVLQNCKVLNLSFNRITHLNCFPNLSQLQRLVVQGNNIPETELQVFQKKYQKKLEIL